MSPPPAPSLAPASHQGGPLILASRGPVADCYGDCGPDPGSVVIGRDGDVQVHPGSQLVLGDQGQSDHECLAAKAGLALARWACEGGRCGRAVSADGVVGMENLLVRLAAAWAGLGPPAAGSGGGGPAGEPRGGPARPGRTLGAPGAGEVGGAAAGTQPV